MALLLTYKIFCPVSNSWEEVTLDHLSPAPTTCPNHSNAIIDGDKTSIQSQTEETFVSAVSPVSTTSTSFQLVSNMSLTPSSGIWDVHFSCTAETTQGTDPVTEISMFSGGVIVENSRRKLGANATATGLLGADASALVLVPVGIRTRIVSDGTLPIEIKFKALSSGSGIKITERTFTIVKVQNG